MGRSREDHPTRISRCLITGITLAFVATLIMAAFTWPAVYAEPRGVPVGLVGSDQAASSMAATLNSARPHEFAVSRYPTRETAIDAIRHREVYGALVVADPPELLAASGASTVTTQLLTGLAPVLTGGEPASSEQITVTDVVPLSPHDDQGAGLSAFFFPLLLGGLKGGIFIALGIQGTARRLLTLAVSASVAGVAVAVVGQLVFRILSGVLVLNVAASGMTIAAIAATVIGLRNLVGLHGVGVGTVLIMLVGSPISAAMLPVEFLPSPWGTIGQYFPPGASVSLIRAISYFPDASTLPQWSVLGLWTFGGTVLAIATSRRPQAWARSTTPPSVKAA